MATCGSFIIAEKKDLDNLLYKEYHVLNPTKYGNLQGRVKFPTGGEPLASPRTLHAAPSW